MTRWVGSNGQTKTTAEIDLTGTSFNERCKTNTQNLNDMIHYLEYAKNTGYPAARADIEQEEYWALLLRDILIQDIIEMGTFIRNKDDKIIGTIFRCMKCNEISKIELIEGVYILTSKCCHIYDRKDDVKDYFERYLQRINLVNEESKNV